MALSHDGLYKPINDFILKTFQSQADSHVVFRFDRFGSVLSDDDFIDESHPDQGYLATLAREKFSDLVNRAPLDEGDGINVVLGPTAIDSLYFSRLLSPAQALIPADADASSKQALIEGFTATKAAALRLWEQITAESMTGLVLDYKPSLATPEDWYDMASTESWTQHVVSVKEAGGPSVQPNQPAAEGLWRLRLSDAAVQHALELHDAKEDATPSTPMITNRIVQNRMRLARAAIGPQTVANRGQIPGVHHAPVFSPGAVRGVAASAGRHDLRLAHLQKLNMRQRVAVAQVLGTVAPTAPVTTTELTVSFDYCLVSIRRPWLADFFINSGPWYVPNVAMGQVTSSEVGGLPLLPVGFVAVRKLDITGNWAPGDLQAASEATSLGPFKVSGGIVAGHVKHLGLQIIGWLLEKLPALPPYDPPS
jgi:hypothetical protein